MKPSILMQAPNGRLALDNDQVHYDDPTGFGELDPLKAANTLCQMGSSPQRINQTGSQHQSRTMQQQQHQRFELAGLGFTCSPNSYHQASNKNDQTSQLFRVARQRQLATEAAGASSQLSQSTARPHSYAFDANHLPASFQTGNGDLSSPRMMNNRGFANNNRFHQPGSSMKQQLPPRLDKEFETTSSQQLEYANQLRSRLDQHQLDDDLYNVLDESMDPAQTSIHLASQSNQGDMSDSSQKTAEMSMCN